MKPTLSEPLSAMPVWRRQLDAWIESDSSKPFCVEGLLLTFEQVKQLNTEFAGVKGLLCSITNNSIKIIRTL